MGTVDSRNQNSGYFCGGWREWEGREAEKLIVFQLSVLFDIFENNLKQMNPNVKI